MDKFQRIYRITIGSGDSIITIGNPLTATINIERNPAAAASSADISIIGLSRKTRDLIFKDKFDTGAFLPILVEAGYDGQLIQIFAGNIMYSYSMRDLPTIVTKIYAYDGGAGIVNARSSWSASKNMSKADILNKLTNDLKPFNIFSGETGDVKIEETAEHKNARGIIFDANTMDVMNRMTGGSVHIDDNKVNMLKSNEVLEGVVPLINSATGLFGTPQRQDTYVDVEMLFEPRIVLQQVVDVESSIQSAYNGQYKVVSVKHSIVISDAVAGEAKTTIGILAPPKVSEVNQGFNLVKNNIVTPYQGLNTPIDGDVKSVLNYILQYGKPPNTRITSGILWSSMLRNFRAGTSFHPSNETPTLQQLQNVKMTAISLQNICDLNFPNHAININSGWRSQIGLYHTTGQAVDFTISGVSNSQVQNVFNVAWFGGVGSAAGHTHADLRGYKYDFRDADF